MEAGFEWIVRYGYAALFAMLVLGIIGLPVPDETLLTFTGYLVFHHKLELLPSFFAAFAGTACGITLSYGLGRLAGRYMVDKPRGFLWIKPAHLEAVRRWFDRFGKYTLFIGYFVPGLRHLTAFVAGSAGLSWPVFGVFAYSGGFVWSAGFILLGYVLGEEWHRVSPLIHRSLLIGAGVVCLAVIGWLLLKRSRPVQSA
jgi:membrane protein DedA with SNARE-associated domain